MMCAVSAHAITAWYQPTPYPDKQAGGTAMPQDINIVHVWDGWFGSYYNQTLVRDDKLQIGGWGDYYTSPLRFDLAGLPTTVDSATLYLWALPSGAANPSQVSLFPITSVWDPTTVGWNNFPSTSSGYYWPVSTAVNTWRGYSITGWYADWKSGARSDEGILIWPYNNDGTQRFDKFVSSRSVNDGQRPLLGLTFTPTLQLKMPLLGSHAWLVTTEVGGYDCKGSYDQYHDGTNYFSVDFSWKNVADSGATVYTNPDPNLNRQNNGVYIPVIAAAGGKVIEATYTSSNGYYVVIDHDSDGNPGTGFQTRYLHLQPSGPVVATGDTVTQGQIIGYMGNTGLSEGAHLHFGVRYANNGAKTASELTKVVMDEWLLKSFQTECSVDANGCPTNWIRYYRSGNTAY